MKIPAICFKLQCFPVLLKISVWKGICPHFHQINYVQPWNHHQVKPAFSNINNPPLKLKASKRPQPIKIESTDFSINILQSTLKAYLDQLQSTSEMQTSTTTQSIFNREGESEPEVSPYKLQYFPDQPLSPPTTRTPKVSSKLDLMVAIKRHWLNLLTRKMKNIFYLNSVFEFLMRWKSHWVQKTKQNRQILIEKLIHGEMSMLSDFELAFSMMSSIPIFSSAS